MILFAIPSFAQVSYNGKLEFTFELITKVARFDKDTMAPIDTIEVNSIKYQLFRRIVGSLDSTMFVELTAGDTTVLIENFSVGVWDIGYRGVYADAESGKIYWSKEKHGWDVTVKDENAIIWIVLEGTFIGFRFIK